MKYNPEIHKRKSIRLKGYDYSQAGLYFITICCQNRECLFGNIGRGEPMCSPEMVLNDAGKMVEKWYYELMNKFPDIKCDEMIVMPNHFHCIIENVGMAVGENEKPILGEHVGSPLHAVVRWFKTMTTNEYIRGVKNLGWTQFDGKLWQRNYYEHIIRNEQSYHTISNYIINNPAKWQEDKFYAI
jgi:putative transposase